MKPAIIDKKHFEIRRFSVFFVLKRQGKVHISQKNEGRAAIPVFLSNDTVELQNQILKFAPH